VRVLSECANAHWLQPDHWSCIKEHLWLRLCQPPRACIPPAALQVQTVDEQALRWGRGDGGSVAGDNLKVKADDVDRKLFTSGVVLEGSSGEGRSEEEARQPEGRRGAVLIPVCRLWALRLPLRFGAVFSLISVMRVRMDTYVQLLSGVCRSQLSVER
jgi:hypothetical protein